MAQNIIDKQEWQCYGETITTAIVECKNHKGKTYYSLYDISGTCENPRSFNPIPTLQEAYEALQRVTGVKKREQINRALEQGADLATAVFC